jgi:protein-S-isoprenylcysteine O-methyltransferase Ste14
MPREWNTFATVIVWVCWGLFGLVWVIGAAYNALRAPTVRQRSAPAYIWLLGVVAAWVIFRAVPGADWHSLSAQTAWLRLIGLAVLVASTAFTLWARVVLGTMWTASPAAKDAHVLHTQGPYAITRHPIYTGILGMLLGTAAAAGLGRWLAVFLAGVVWAEIRIHTEERLLTKVFPEDYERYRRRVPQLIPGLRRPTALRHGASPHRPSA